MQIFMVLLVAAATMPDALVQPYGDSVYSPVIVPSLARVDDASSGILNAANIILRSKRQNRGGSGERTKTSYITGTPQGATTSFKYY